MRSSFDYWVTGINKNSFWYLDSSLFNNSDNHIKTVSNVSASFRKSKKSSQNIIKKSILMNTVRFIVDCLLVGCQLSY